MKTAMTELLGIEHPILLPGMSWISQPELVSAVSQAGGLGILATGPLSAEQTLASIQEVRKRTDRPFGVGVTLLMPGAAENARVALAAEVPVVNFQLGSRIWAKRRPSGALGVAEHKRLLVCHIAPPRV